MKTLLTFLFSILSFFSYCQDKYNYTHFDNFTELIGTDYVMGTIENLGKMASRSNEYLLFINARTGERKQIDFGKNSYIHVAKQIVIDNLGINKVLVEVKMLKVENKNRLIWDSPSQMFVISVDGGEKNQLVENNFLISKWTINNKAGTILISGHYDSNSNGKYDKTDKNEISLFDLKTLKLISRF